jgi:hypothetical protein
MGEVYEEDGDFVAALAYYERAAEEKPDPRGVQMKGCSVVSCLILILSS